MVHILYSFECNPLSTHSFGSETIVSKTMECVGYVSCTASMSGNWLRGSKPIQQRAKSISIARLVAASLPRQSCSIHGSSSHRRSIGQTLEEGSTIRRALEVIVLCLASHVAVIRTW